MASSRVLITAFEPYDGWQSNARWLALVELTKQLPTEPKVTTRLYPVDFDRVRAKLEDDLRAGFDVAIHLGQAPGIAAVHLEMMAINIRRELQSTSDIDPPLSED